MLMRPTHWIKNGLVFLPLVFGGELFQVDKLGKLLVAFFVFCLIASLVYFINDARDREKDKLHPAKKHRPLASGAVSLRAAIVAGLVLLVVSIGLGIWMQFSALAWVLLGAYFVMNVGYSFGLKNVPIVDIAILSAGFVIRVLYGAEVAGIEVSNWLYLTVLTGALYMSLGKRRNEIQRNGTKSRKVNKYYSITFLDKNMYVFLGLLFVFYSLWATDPVRGESYMYLTIPLLIFTFMAYSLAIEKSTSSGDPVDVLMSNKGLLVFAAMSAIITIGLVYV